MPNQPINQLSYRSIPLSQEILTRPEREKTRTKEIREIRQEKVKRTTHFSYFRMSINTQKQPAPLSSFILHFSFIHSSLPI
jgi:hypothetical protein